MASADADLSMASADPDVSMSRSLSHVSTYIVDEDYWTAEGRDAAPPLAQPQAPCSRHVDMSSGAPIGTGGANVTKVTFDAGG